MARKTKTAVPQPKVIRLLYKRMGSICFVCGTDEHTRDIVIANGDTHTALKYAEDIVRERWPRARRLDEYNRQDDFDFCSLTWRNFLEGECPFTTLEPRHWPRPDEPCPVCGDMGTIDILDRTDNCVEAR